RPLKGQKIVHSPVQPTTPNQNQAARELRRLVRHPAVDGLGREPVAGFNLVRMQRKWSLVAAAVNPDKLITGFRTGVHLEQSFRSLLQPDTQFLPNFADGTRLVSFASIQMAGGR